MAILYIERSFLFQRKNITNNQGMPGYVNISLPCKQEIITTGDNISYLLKIYTGVSNDVLFFGGKYDYCIEVQIDHDINETEGLLTHIYYEEVCLLNTKVKRGIGTQDMLRTVISVIRSKYPHITSLSFTDTSSRTCDNGYTVNLYHMYYLLYGKTWYMKTFGAVFKNPNDAKKMEQADRVFQVYKQQLSWDRFNDRIMNTRGKEYISSDDLQQIYLNTKTWQEFFIQVRDTIGAADFCLWISTWMEKLMTMANFSFHIPMKTFLLPFSSSQLQQLPSVTIGKYISEGGRRHTRRKRRQQRGGF